MEKGLETLIQAMQIVLRKFPETMLCLVGGPKEMIPGYTTLAAKLGMNEKLLVFDYVVPAEVKQFINSFDVCVIPFPWTEHFAYYASPLKLFEYMAAGKPILATGLPSIREILQDGTSAVLVRPSDSESLANGILRVLTDEALAKKIGENAKKEVMQKYTWEKRARAVLGFIEGDA
ncbi:MAG TPA: glycosyltransferase family 4 protein [Candidatus Diapherotrites archaeon]|uniref:Glycosyltransferase family 4 protein n=1 Tax=Candidatus Iainarchaeum sp. TaxID=3101447 RepID=A0A7J4JF23_9ARCH|nr:glycosyltransferase family 4 protein [Candidatus Diapherotrites archaeon]